MNKTIKYFGITILLPLLVFCFYSGKNPGTCLKFDGADDYVECTNYLKTLTIPFSFEAWIYYSDDNANRCIFTSEDPDIPDILTAKYTGFWCAIVNNKLNIQLGDGNGNGPSNRRGAEANNTIPKNKWLHIACAVNSINNIRIYFNGVSQPVTYIGSGASLGHDATHVTRISRTTYWELRYAKVQMDEIRVWNRALPQTEIRQNMCQKLKGNESGLMGYWRMDEGSGNMAYDRSGNGNHGILH